MEVWYVFFPFGLCNMGYCIGYYVTRVIASGMELVVGSHVSFPVSFSFVSSFLFFLLSHRQVVGGSFFRYSIDRMLFPCC